MCLWQAWERLEQEESAANEIRHCSWACRRSSRFSAEDVCHVFRPSDYCKTDWTHPPTHPQSIKFLRTRIFKAKEKKKKKTEVYGNKRQCPRSIIIWRRNLLQSSSVFSSSSKLQLVFRYAWCVISYKGRLLQFYGYHCYMFTIKRKPTPLLLTCATSLPLIDVGFALRSRKKKIRCF
jgi:hypothetical protein